MKTIIKQLKIVTVMILLGGGVFAFAQQGGQNFLVNLIVNNEDVVEVVWATPELRVGEPHTNDDSNYVLYFHSSAEGDGSHLHDDALYVTELLSTNGEGAGPWIDVGDDEPIPFGTYDIFIKTDQHLAEKMNDFVIGTGYNQLNYSQNGGSFVQGDDQYFYRGPNRLLAGDVSNSATDPSQIGDNVVNSVDLSILLGDLDGTDPDGNTVRSNVNQDPEINSVDLSIYLKNLDLEGDRP